MKALPWLCAALLAGVSATAISVPKQASAEDTLTVISWGGAYQESQRKAFMEPYAKETGTKINEGEYNGETDGALWSDPLFRRCSRRAMPQLVRIVIAVDPSGAKHAKDLSADEIGIVIAGLGEDGILYVLQDLSLRASPAVWGNLIVAAYERVGADAVIVEDNFGGPLVETVLRQISPNICIRNAHASTGKHIRAEPVAALYERGLVRHVGESTDYEALEDQLMQFTAAGYMGPGSPDRGDALVWAGTALMLGKQAGKASGGSAFDLAQRSR